MAAGKTPKGTRTKNRIIESSIGLINQKGFANVTLNDICAASEVAPGTFYHYFASTNNILKEVLKLEGEEMIENYKNIMNLPPPKKLNQIISFQLDYFEKKGKEVVAEIYRMELNADSGFSTIDELLPIQTLLNEIISAGQETGDFSRENSPEDNAILIMSLFAYYSFRWITAKDNTSLKSLASRQLNKVINQIILTR